jgi:hypothetical protein
MLLSSTRSPLDPTEPQAVSSAAAAYLQMLQATCPDDAACMQKFQFANVEELKGAQIGEPWAAFVMTYKDIRETQFQDLLKVAKFNYFACPIVANGKFRGVVRVCRDPDEPQSAWSSCGSRGPTRLAEVNTFSLTQAPESDSLAVICVLTVQNNARYILVKQGTEYYAIAASDQGAELINSMTWHVSRMTKFPLNEALYKLSVNVKKTSRQPR